MQQTVLDAYPQAALTALVIWVPMLASDSVDAADAQAALVRDPRALHFYDGARRAGRAIAASLGGHGDIAWDTYLFYRPGLAWSQTPPAPDRWMHQLGPSTWADPTRFRWADSLISELGAAARSLLG